MAFSNNDSRMTIPMTMTMSMTMTMTMTMPPGNLSGVVADGVMPRPTENLPPRGEVRLARIIPDGDYSKAVLGSHRGFNHMFE